MSSGLSTYPQMKESGALWLGEVPAHWRLLRLGALLRERGETNDDGRIADVLSVTKDRGVIPYADKGNVGNKKSEDTTRYKIVRPNDIVLNSMNVIIGSVGLSQYTGCLSPVYYVLVPRSHEDEPQYLNAYFQTRPFQQSLVRIGNGILAHRMRIPMELLKCEPFPLPPPDEQRAIVRYLDHVDRRIRRYIRAKQKLIKLLEEQKQAIIHRAVTRGLDPNVCLKPSGVDWLGDIPTHWELKRIKYLLREVDNRSSTGDETLLSLRMNHGIVPHDEHFARPGQASSLVGYKIVGPGQVVLNRLQANNGLIFASAVSGVVSPDYAVFDPIGSVNVQYLTALFRTPMMKHKFRIESRGLGTGTAGFLRLYTDRFGTIPVPVPPHQEQIEIMGGLEILLAELTSTVNRVEREIDLFREYRTRLVTDVVTGKIDVRKVAARLPDELEPEPPEDAASLSEDAAESEESFDESSEETDL